MKKNYLKPNTKVVNVAINRIICASNTGMVHSTSTNLGVGDDIEFGGAGNGQGQTVARGRQNGMWDDDEE